MGVRWLAGLVLFWASTFGVRADRDIVYAARYYTPPGSHQTSHFHLYRINPDGTGRTQLTFGGADETDPHWSPDGRRVLFTRTFWGDQEGAGHQTLCLLSPDGGRTRRLWDCGASEWWDWSDACWLPDGQTVSVIHKYYARRASASTIYLVDVRTGRAKRLIGTSLYLPSPDGRKVYRRDTKDWIADAGKGMPVSPSLDTPVWVSNSQVAGITDSWDGLRPKLRLRNTRGQEAQRLLLRFPDGHDYDGSYFGGLLPSPHPGMVIYALDEHDSTVGTLCSFMRVRLSDASMRSLTQGQFLAWSPDGSRFCTAPGRDTWTYRERKWDGTFKTVWAAPLQVGSYGGGRLKTITPGLVWVDGADWRKKKP